MMSLEVEPESIPLKDVECADRKSDANNIEHDLSKRGWQRFAGILFALLAGISFCLVNLGSKMLTQDNYHPFNIIFWMCPAFILTAPLHILYLWIVKKKNVYEDISEGKRKLIFLLLVRGGIVFVGVSCSVYSLEYLTVADATVIIACTPIVVTLFARIFLGEPCGIVPVTVVLVIFSGVVVLARPPMLTGTKEIATETLIGTLLAFATTVAYSMAFIVIRGLRQVHLSLHLLFFGFVMSILGLIMSLSLGVFEVPRSWDGTMIMLGCFVTALFGQTFQTLSLKWEEAGPVALVRTLDIVFAFILQLIFLRVYPDIFSYIGACVIALGVIATAFRKWLSMLSEEHPSRVRYSFMLK